jgi:hypothetical protein
MFYIGQALSVLLAREQNPIPASAGRRLDLRGSA